MTEPILCYVRSPWAYFTFKPLSEQWGDDWNDAPYDCNASPPYQDKEEEIIKVAFDGEFDEPKDFAYNCPFSVQMINNKLTPWLTNIQWYQYAKRPKPINIMAGTPLNEFIRMIQDGGGRVYIEFLKRRT